MYYNPSDERAYTYFVKLPMVEQKFAMGCKKLGLAHMDDITKLANEVGKATKFVFSNEPAIYCFEMDKVIANNEALRYCISKGYHFEVLNGIRGL